MVLDCSTGAPGPRIWWKRQPSTALGLCYFCALGAAPCDFQLPKRGACRPKGSADFVDVPGDTALSGAASAADGTAVGFNVGIFPTSTSSRRDRLLKVVT